MGPVNTVLEEIIAEKEKEVRRLRSNRPVLNHGEAPTPARDFKRAISKPKRINLIAEIKFASPSAGIIRRQADPIEIGQIYEEAGAAAISVLTDKKFFNGDLGQLPRLKKAISLPILRKDFIVDEIQLRESYVFGADAVLLIARILSRPQLERFLGTCQALGLAALTEVHDEKDLNKALKCGAAIIGINNRNLDTFKVSLDTTLRLAPMVPKGLNVVSESGIKDKEDIQRLREASVQAILVGTSIMKSENIAGKTKELVDAGGGY